MVREKACGDCNGCKGGRGCEEHHRRCKEWPCIANTFHAGSVVTSVSSQFDLLTADLSKYENTLELLRDLDLELEEDMDRLPQGSTSRDNPRFNPAGRARELDDERNHLARLSVLLQRHGELATRLQEVADDDDEPHVVDETRPVEDSVVLTGRRRPDNSSRCSTLTRQELQEPELCSLSRTTEKNVYRQLKRRRSVQECCREEDGLWTATTMATNVSSLPPSSRCWSLGV